MLPAPRHAGAICILIVSVSFLLGGTTFFSPTPNPVLSATTGDPTYYLHRTFPLTPIPVPFGLRMNTTSPPVAQTETSLTLNKGTNYYWYSDAQMPGCAAAGTWTFYLWADTATAQSTLDVHVDLTNSGGTNVRAIGNFIGKIINSLTPTSYTITVPGSGLGVQNGDRIRLTLTPEGGGSNDSHMTIIYDGYGSETPGAETRLSTAVSFSNCILNLRVRNSSATDSIAGAYVYVNSSTSKTNATGWTSWVSLGGFVQVKVQYFGYWVNGTFTIALDSNKTIDIRANIYDVTVTVRPSNQQGILQTVNVTAYNSTTYGPSNMVATAITGSNGQAILKDVPSGSLFFASFAKSDYSVLIAQNSQNVTAQGQSVSLVGSQNAGAASLPWDVYIIVSLTTGGTATLNRDMWRKRKN